MSSNYQRLSVHKHRLSPQNTYKSYKREKEMTKQAVQERKQEIQFTCGNKLSTYSDDQMTFQKRPSEPLIVSLDNFEEEMDLGESLAQYVIDENVRLKQEVQSLRQQNKTIRLELQTLNSRYLQLKSNKEVGLYKKKIKQLKEELILTLGQNREINEEILKLKQSVTHYKENVQSQQYQYQRTTFKNISNQARARSNSVQVYQRNSHKANEQRETEQQRKEKQLLESIKFMHAKITGYKNQSLKELWRWLKEIGHFYSRFRKWKSKAQNYLDHFYYPPATYEDMVCLIEQSIGLVQ